MRHHATSCVLISPSTPDTVGNYFKIMAKYSQSNWVAEHDKKKFHHAYDLDFICSHAAIGFISKFPGNIKFFGSNTAMATNIAA